MCNSTHDGTWRALAPDERQRFAEALAERDLQLTLQREVIYELVVGCPGHICAEHILDIVSASRPGLRMNKTTVYRTLDLLVDLGLVREHKCGEGAAQYEPAARGPHSHLLCQRCGRLENLDETLQAEIQATLLARHGFVAELESYPVLGLCADCRS